MASEYLSKLFLTLVIVAACFGLLIGLHSLLGVWGVVGGFVTLIAAAIGIYNYNLKKEKESCSRRNKE